MLDDECVVPSRVGLAGGAVTVGWNSAMAKDKNNNNNNTINY